MSTRTASGSFDDDVTKFIKVAFAVGAVVSGFKALLWLIDSFGA